MKQSKKPDIDHSATSDKNFSDWFHLKPAIHYKGVYQGTWYVPFEFKNREQIAVLAQARVLSVFRLYKKMGGVPDSDLELVRDGFRKLYL